MPHQKWKFKSGFRREAYNWEERALAFDRIRNAVSEIERYFYNLLIRVMPDWEKRKKRLEQVAL